MTRLEIRDPRPGAASSPPVGILGGAIALEQPDEWGFAQVEQDTWLRLFPSVNPGRARLRARSFDLDSGVEAHADAWKEPRSATTTGRVDVAQEDVEPHRVSMWGINTLAAVAAVVVVGLVVAMLTGGGQGVPVAPSPINQGTEALDSVDAPPAPVTPFSGGVEDGRVTWTWIEAEESHSGFQSESGFCTAKTDHYVYMALRPGEDPILNNIDVNTVTSVGVPGENRLQVVAASEWGRQSSVVEECVNVK